MEGDGAAVRDRTGAGEVHPVLFRLLWLSVGAALLTIGLKLAAWGLTGSVGLLSDALESVVNLVAAVVALAALRWAATPADEEHLFGHAKAEYLAAGVEGALILAASVAITVTAVIRLLDPRPLTDVGAGVAVSLVAAAVNLVVAVLLIRAGRAHRAVALEADGRHLLTDVWTSVGVVAGIGAVALTGWERLDPLIAIAIAANIAVTGVRLLDRAVGGLMDRSLDRADTEAIRAALAPFGARGIRFHALRTRQAGRRAFVSVHVLAPGHWTLLQGHDLAEEVEAAIRGAVPHATVFTHVEPVEDPRSFEDAELDRPEGAR